MLTLNKSFRNKCLPYIKVLEKTNCSKKMVTHNKNFEKTNCRKNAYPE